MTSLLTAAPVQISSTHDMNLLLPAYLLPSLVILIGDPFGLN